MHTLTKLALCTTLVAGIGTSIVVLSPEGETPEAQADIVEKVAPQVMVGHDFTSVLEASGLEPRAYRVNGNTVYFAVGYSSASPTELLVDYQRRFKIAGLNKKEFYKMPDALFSTSFEDLQKIGSKDAAERQKGVASVLALAGEESMEYTEHLFEGGIVPMEILPTYIKMGGLVPKDGVNNLDTFMMGVLKNKQPQLYENVKGFRFLDAQAIDKEAKTSRVTAVWAEDDFDFRRMDNPDRYGAGHVTSLPRCAGCSVGMEMDSLQPNEPYRASTYRATQSVPSIATEYRNTMRNKGWRLSDADTVFEYMRRLGIQPPIDGELLSFERNGKQLDVLIAPPKEATGESRIHAFERR